MTRTRAMGCALWLGSCAAPLDARAHESADEATKPEVEAPEPTHRFALGATWSGLGAAGATVGVGGLAGMPGYHLAYEPRVARMLRLLLRVEGAYGAQSVPGAESEGFGMGGRLGLRAEQPLAEVFGVGGYAAAEGRGLRVTFDQADQSSANTSLMVGGVAGLSAAYHPTSFFGLRVSADLLRGSYARNTSGGGVAESAAVELVVHPAGELTFSF